jgi:hypothetical protein
MGKLMFDRLIEWAMLTMVSTGWLTVMTVAALMLAAACSTLGDIQPSASMSTAPGPCGQIHTGEVSAGVPLRLHAGDKIITIHSEHGASVIVEPECKQEDVSDATDTSDK